MAALGVVRQGQESTPAIILYYKERVERLRQEEDVLAEGRPIPSAEIVDGEDEDDDGNELIRIYEDGQLNLAGTAGKPTLSPSGTPWPKKRRVF